MAQPVTTLDLSGTWVVSPELSPGWVDDVEHTIIHDRTTGVFTMVWSESSATKLDGVVSGSDITGTLTIGIETNCPNDIYETPFEASLSGDGALLTILYLNFSVSEPPECAQSTNKWVEIHFDRQAADAPQGEAADAGPVPQPADDGTDEKPASSGSEVPVAENVDDEEPTDDGPEMPAAADTPDEPAAENQTAETPDEPAAENQTAPTGTVAELSDALRGRIAAAVAALEAEFPAEDAPGFRALLADPSVGVPAATLGQLMFVRRHFDKAAWFFGEDLLTGPATAPSLNNFSVMLVEVYANDPDTYPAEWLETALEASRLAVALDPEHAAYHNNLGQAARQLAALNSDPTLADEAVAALRRATGLAEQEPLYWANMAEALAQAGDPTGAGQALVRARTLDPNGPATLMAMQALGQSPEAAGAVNEELRNSCNVNFRCGEICPRSIIGGLMRVTCEIESSSAQLACQEGQPHATTYNCQEELPEYGILIPGLNAGFSVAVPGFTAHVLVDGDGTVRTRVEAGVSLGPVGGYVRTDGEYSPDGGVSFSNTGGGLRVSVLNKGPAAATANSLGHPPAHLELETLDGEPAEINAEVYNASVISH